MIKYLKQIIFILYLSLVGCLNQDDESTKDEERSENNSTSTNQSSPSKDNFNTNSKTQTPQTNSTTSIISDEKAANIVFKITVKMDQSLNLIMNNISATSFDINILNCASGFNPSFDETSINPKLYKGDVNCVAKLKSFMLDGVLWEMDPINHDEFCFGESSICTFWNPTETVSVRVEVIESLNLIGLNSSETASWRLTESKLASTRNLATIVSVENTGAGTDIGTPPSMTLNIIYLDFTNAQNAGSFKIKLACSTDINDNSSIDPDDWECNGSILSSYKIKLIDDIYSGNLNQAQGDSEMSSGTTNIQAASGHIFNIDADMEIEEGGIILNLVGPNDVYNNRNMILILSDGSTNYKFWSLTALQVN